MVTPRGPELDAETAATCASAGCIAPAAWRVFWPGQTSSMCEACRDRARGVAHAMGFGLAVEPLHQVASAATVVQQAPTRRADSVEVWPTLFDFAPTPAVRKAMEARHAFGVAKYGQALVTHDGRDTVTDALQELLDAAVYLQKHKIEHGQSAGEYPSHAIMTLLLWAAGIVDHQAGKHGGAP